MLNKSREEIERRLEIPEVTDAMVNKVLANIMQVMDNTEPIPLEAVIEFYRTD